MKNKLLILIACVAVIFIGARTYYGLTDDFRLGNIQTDTPPRPEWNLPPLSQAEQQELATILNQPFTYIGKGAQSYVFGSEDQKYVIKFFKFKHLRPSIWIDLIPPIGALKTYKDKQIQRKQRKFESAFIGYKLAYLKDKDLSGLIFVKFNPTQNVYPLLTVHDKMGLVRHIDLNTVPFIIQKRGITLRQVLKQQLEQKQVEEAIVSILKIFDLYQLEYQRGLWDHDHGVLQNAGFIHNEPAHLDVGKLTETSDFQDPQRAQADMLILVEKINEWMKSNFPKYADQVNEAMQKYLDNHAKQSS